MPSRALVWRAALLPVTLAALILAAPGAQAQYFGRNKVQYRTFDFKVLKTEHFDIYFYPEEREAVEQAARMAERWYVRLSELLEHHFEGRQPLILYASHPHFEQTNAIEGELGESTGGVTEILKRRVVLPLAGPLAETDHVLGHELVHAFQFDVTGQGGPVSAGNAPTALRLPLWFIEGMAEYLSVGPVDPHTAMWMRDAAARNKLPTIRQLGNPQYFPYRYGQALWAYIAGRWGDEVVGRILKAAGRAGNAEDALKEVLGVSAEDLSKDWHEAIQAAYKPLAEVKKAAREYGRALITEKAGGGELNVAPALSPDGRQLIFLSERDLFSIDMFLADAETGAVKRKIVETAVDPHFESLQFINSAGAWDARSRRFAFGAVRGGQAVLTLFDVPGDRIEREIRLRELGEIFSPTWSPDGRFVAFSAITGGLTDLFLYDLQSDTLKRLTNDAFADLQPAWSPDGKAIAFVTDRFSTRLETLATGNYRLALLDPRTGDIRPLPGFEEAKNINPQWSADSQSLYFLSDRNGISNVYRLDLASGESSQVTDLLTGATGITALSPALSVASSAPRLVFSVYEESNHHIYAIDSRSALAGSNLAPEGPSRAALLPPQKRGASEVVAQQENARFGLPALRPFRPTEYRPKLSLDYVGQPTLGVGTGPLGTYVGGGAALFFSDMLGNHNVGTLLQVNGGLEDVAGVVSYTNLKSRWNWGVAVGQIPYVTGTFSTGIANVGGEPALVEETFRFRQTNREVSGVVAYPFNRAQRVELTAGYRNITFDREVDTLAVSARTGRVIVDDRVDLPAPPGLNLGEAGAALVYDTSAFGATSPILGQRYRLDVTTTVGTVRYTGLLADYRRYVIPVRPYTLAFRLLHYGRYGRDGDTDRLQPLFLGYPNLVRGYDTGSFSADECDRPPARTCPVFDQLLGSRLLVGNLELRFPLLAPFGAKRLYGPLPVELAFFGDTGVAWTSEEGASFLGGDRKMVKSVGAAARINLFGYLIVEVDYVHPLDRPRKNWIWQLNFSPGF